MYIRDLHKIFTLYVFCTVQACIYNADYALVTSSLQINEKNWSRVPDGCLTARWTGRLTDGRNITLTFGNVCFLATGFYVIIYTSF
jgi:hypothetical protein